MKWFIEKVLPMLISVIIAIAGWIFGNYLSSQRDQTNKRRELCVQYLHEAYQNLMDAACYSPIEEQENTFRLITKASANIQLFGNEEQIQMDKEFNKDYPTDKTVSLDKLIISLRDDLRKELGLSQTEKKLHWFKVKKKDPNLVSVNSKTASQD
jgi:hypothetical protein